MFRFKQQEMDDLANNYKRGIPDFPDHWGYAIKEDKLPQRYGRKRFRSLTETPEYKGLAVLLEDIPKHMRRYIPQDDPRWLELRKQAQLTGSVSAELIGFHDETAAGLLGLPGIMFRRLRVCPFNDKWNDIRVRFKYGELPRTPMDPPGNVNCAQGKVKEANALAYIMDSIPTMEFREVGAIEITEDQLACFNLVNVFKNNERITSFPDKFKIVISPDGDITAPASAASMGGEDDGHIFDSQMEDMALELKFPTFFGEKTSSPFRGFEYYPKGEKMCKVYDYPKTYYLPQCFLEMLALKRKSLLFGCATYASGMKVWKIEMNETYLSLILSVMILMFEKFTVKDQPVPTDYFFQRYSMDHPTRQKYEQLLTMTKQISETSPIYMVISGSNTKRITSEIGVVSTNTFLRFPNLPEEVIPTYQLLCVYGRRLLHKFEDLTWVSAYTQFDSRQRNINTLADTALTAFSFDIMKDIYTTVYNKYCGPYEGDETCELRGLDVIKNRIIESMEKFLLQLYRFIFKLYGSPAFGYDQELDLTVLNKNIVDMLYEMCITYNTPAQYSVFGSLWINELLAIPDIWTKEFEVSSPNVYKQVLMDASKFDIDGQGEDLENPHDWQYHRVIAVLLLVKV